MCCRLKASFQAAMHLHAYAAMPSADLAMLPAISHELVHAAAPLLCKGKVFILCFCEW